MPPALMSLWSLQQYVGQNDTTSMINASPAISAVAERLAFNSSGAHQLADYTLSLVAKGGRR